MEAEALGACINLGNAEVGPRAGEATYPSLEAFLEENPVIDFHKGRVDTLLKACHSLHQAGENVVAEISGPLTILSALVGLPLLIKN